VFVLRTDSSRATQLLLALTGLLTGFIWAMQFYLKFAMDFKTASNIFYAGLGVSVLLNLAYVAAGVGVIALAVVSVV
jgi:hypothetical protein